MFTILCEENCGNSPKKEQLKKLTIDIAINKIDTFLNIVTDNITWNIVGVKQIEGKQNVAKMLSGIHFKHPKRLEIHNIITHGNKGSVNGTFLYEQQTIHFCSIFNFAGHSKNAKIKAITSYVIKLKTTPLCNDCIREISF